MLQKDKSITKLSRSSTNRDRNPSVQFVKGVGPRLASVFSSREIETVKDLLYFFPRLYEDRTAIREIGHLQEGEKATTSLTVLGVRSIPIQKLGRSILEARCTDSRGGTLRLKWFYVPPGLQKRLIPGTNLVATGKVKFYNSQPEMVHPELNWGATSYHQNSQEKSQKKSEDKTQDQNAERHFGRVVPIYIEIEGVSTRTLRTILWHALDQFGDLIQEDLPSYLLTKRNLSSLPDAVRNIHFPPEDKNFGLEQLSAFDSPAHRRLIYGEFFKFEYLVLRRRLQEQHIGAPTLPKPLVPPTSLVEKLPFRLTAGQQQALEEILADFSKPYPMNRLIQGDVGAGKTVVALLAAAAILEMGGQVALMAPTEILSEQHYQNARKLFGQQMKSFLLTGRTSLSDRTLIQQSLSSGDPLLLIGTHALLEDPVSFTHLSFVIIDEQHRFGVEQRRTLRNKGQKSDPNTGVSTLPHSLILTATPIPRTLALSAFGDLSVSSIRELPPGRTPIITRVVKNPGHRKEAYQAIARELKCGKQAYFIYPLINESEAEGFTELKAAVAEAENLANIHFPNYAVGLLHGEMKAEQKAAVMDGFKSGKIQILVSTTVVEVGVDVPNATVMVIEHADRFGLSQLHQLRGRVGRGRDQSYCFLCTHSGSMTERLGVLEKSNDGFAIAEADLSIRGPGEFLGTRQAGGLPFRVADLVRDQGWLLIARDDALELLQEDPGLKKPENYCLKKFFESDGKLQTDRFYTS